MLRDENEANVRRRETAVLKKEDSRLAEGEDKKEGGCCGGGAEPFLKTANYFPNLRGRSREDAASIGRAGKVNPRGMKSKGGEGWGRVEF